MRVPELVKDKSLLDDEPFISAFSLRKEDRTRLNPDQHKEWIKRVSADAEKQDGYESALREWVSLVLGLRNAQVPEITEADRFYFVDAFWQLADGCSSKFDNAVRELKRQNRSELQAARKKKRARPIAPTISSVVETDNGSMTWLLEGGNLSTAEGVLLVESISEVPSEPVTSTLRSAVKRRRTRHKRKTMEVSDAMIDHLTAPTNSSQLPTVLQHQTQDSIKDESKLNVALEDCTSHVILSPLEVRIRGPSHKRPANRRAKSSSTKRKGSTTYPTVTVNTIHTAASPTILGAVLKDDSKMELERNSDQIMEKMLVSTPYHSPPTRIDPSLEFPDGISSGTCVSQSLWQMEVSDASSISCHLPFPLRSTREGYHDFGSVSATVETDDASRAVLDSVSWSEDISQAFSVLSGAAVPTCGPHPASAVTIRSLSGISAHGSKVSSSEHVRTYVQKPTREPKPALPEHVRPKIWAATRQEVCETLPYFRAYQGGVYFRDEIVHGYLLGSHGTELDIFRHGGKLIISHGGGKNEVASREALDQNANDMSVRALLNNWRKGVPVALICDEDYRFFPYDLHAPGHSYVVLGAYLITHAWPQRQVCGTAKTNVIRWMFSFQWCEGQGEPWWLAASPAVDVTREIGKGSDSEAALSLALSERGFFQGGSEASMNLPDPAPSQSPNSTDSERIIAIDFGTEARPEITNTEPSDTTNARLVLKCPACNQGSVQIFEQWSCCNMSCFCFSANTAMKLEDDVQIVPIYAPSFLALLPNCGATIPPSITHVKLPDPNDHDGTTTDSVFRRGFHCTACGRLSCRSKWQKWECRNCGKYIDIEGRIQSASELRLNTKELMDQYRIKDNAIRLVRDIMRPDGSGRIVSFLLPIPDGTVRVHLVTGGEDTADGIFRKYQIHAASNDFFRRWPLRSSRVPKGEMLSNYFSHNAGEPYKYVSGTQQTVSLSESPEAVREALAFIQERAGLVLGSPPELNEVLSAAYLMDQKMSFHSDSEKGLGSIISALSLGSTALMHFRAIPIKQKELSQDSEAKQKTPRSQVALTLELRHGDVIVMEGLEVQDYYQHAVVPTGFRIAATARYIKPSS